MSASVTINDLLFTRKVMPTFLEADDIDIQAIFDQKNWKPVPHGHTIIGQSTHDPDYSEYTVEAWSISETKDVCAYYFGRRENNIQGHMLEQLSSDGIITQYTIHDGVVRPTITIQAFSKSGPPVFRNGLCVIPSPFQTFVSRIKNSALVTFFSGRLD